MGRHAEIDTIRVEKMPVKETLLAVSREKPRKVGREKRTQLCAYSGRSTLILRSLAPVLKRRHADFFTESFNKIAGGVEPTQI